MTEGYTVQPGRILDGAVMTIFTMVVSSFFLYMFKALWFLLNRPEFRWFKVGLIFTTILPFKNSFEYNLTHVFLFSICTLLFSIRCPSTLLGPAAEDNDVQAKSFDFKRIVSARFKKHD